MHLISESISLFGLIRFLERPLNDILLGLSKCYVCNAAVACLARPGHDPGFGEGVAEGPL